MVYFNQSVNTCQGSGSVRSYPVHKVSTGVDNEGGTTVGLYDILRVAFPVNRRADAAVWRLRNNEAIRAHLGDFD